MRQVLLKSSNLGDAIAEASNEVDFGLRAASVKLLFLVGMVAGSPEDLLLASQLQIEHQVDLSLLMSGLCGPRGDGGSPVRCSEAPLLGRNRSVAIQILDDSNSDAGEQVPEEESKEERKKTYEIEDRGKV